MLNPAVSFLPTAAPARRAAVALADKTRKAALATETKLWTKQ